MPNLGGLYQGMVYNAKLSASDMDTYIEFLQQNGHEDRISALFYFPRNLLSIGADGWVNNTTAGSETITATRPNEFQGYTPRNKKLYTFPYMFLSVDCLQSQKCYKWEKCSGYDEITGSPFISFKVYGVVALNPAIVLVPNYDNIENNMTENLYMNFCDGLVYNNTILLQMFGQRGIINKLSGIALSTSLALVNPNLAIAGLSHTKGGFSSDLGTRRFEGESGKYTGGSTARTSRVSESFSQDLLAQQRAETDIQMRGGQALINSHDANWNMLRIRGSGGNYDYATGHQEIYFKKLVIKRQFAEKIDRFFDSYGYAVNTIKVPNIHSRPKWTYTKTKGCVIKGNIPDHYRTEMCNTFDSGIRFWAVGAGGNVDIGNYNQDNSPQTE